MSTLRYKLAELKGRNLQLKKPSRNRIILAALGIAFVSILSFRALNNSTEIAEVSTPPAITTIAVKDHKKNMGTVQASGEVTSINQVNIKSEVSVPVRSVFVHIGERVFAGQPLVEFEHDDLDAQLASANAGVAQARAALDVQIIGVRDEELERARLAVLQAEQSLIQTTAAHEQAEIVNASTLVRMQQGVDNVYENSIQTAQNVLSAATDGLIVVADYQTSYFNCSSHTICKQIETSKRKAMQSLFDAHNAGTWNAQTILLQEGGLVRRVEHLSTAPTVDPVELHAVLARLSTGLQHTRDALVRTREGLETYAGSGSTTADRTAVEAERAAIDAMIVVLQTQIQAVNTTEGGSLVNGEAQALADERARFAASSRSSEAGVQLAEISFNLAQQSLAILVNGPRDIDLATLQSGLLASEASRDNLASQYRRYIITAPFDGVVASLPARAGEIVGAGQTVLSLVNPSALEIVAHVSDKDRPLLESGATVTINNTHSGIVTFISPSINPATGKVEVRIAVLDEDTLLTVGQTVPVQIALSELAGTTDSFQLPLPSVRISPTGSFVMVVNDKNEIEEQLVTTGNVFGERVEVLTGLNINDVIVSSVRGLRVGDKVDVR